MNIFCRCFRQCCVSGMIYSVSGSRYSYEYLDFLPYYLATFENYSTKKTLNSIKKKNIPIICHFLFQSTVLQYTQTRIHRPKMVNKISNLFALSFSAGSGTIIPDPDQGKVPDPDTKHCMVFYICYWLFLINFLLVYIHRQRRPVTTGSVVHPFTVINNN